MVFVLGAQPNYTSLKYRNKNIYKITHLYPTYSWQLWNLYKILFIYSQCPLMWTSPPLIPNTKAQKPFTSTGDLVRGWLFCKLNFPCSLRFWCVLRVGVKVWMMHILYRFIGGQTHCSTFWHVKINLALNEPIWKVLCSSPPHQLQTCTENLPNMEHVICCVNGKNSGIFLCGRAYVRGVGEESLMGGLECNVTHESLDLCFKQGSSWWVLRIVSQCPPTYRAKLVVHFFLFNLKYTF